MTKHCCQQMEERLVLSCSIHGNVFECPDVLISYVPKFDEYGIIIHDGGSGAINISYCPWCGSRLPESKRDFWFDSLGELGYDDPDGQKIPVEFESDAWYRNA